MSLRKTKKIAIRVFNNAIDVISLYVGHTSLSEFLNKAYDFSTFERCLYYAETFNKENGYMVGYDSDTATYDKFDNITKPIIDELLPKMKRVFSFSLLDDILKKDIADAREMIDEIKKKTTKDIRAISNAAVNAQTVVEHIKKDVYRYFWNCIIEKYWEIESNRNTEIGCILRRITDGVNKEICRHNSSEYRKCYNYYCKLDTTE